MSEEEQKEYEKEVEKIIFSVCNVETMNELKELLINYGLSWMYEGNLDRLCAQACLLCENNCFKDGKGEKTGVVEENGKVFLIEVLLNGLIKCSCPDGWGKATRSGSIGFLCGHVLGWAIWKKLYEDLQKTCNYYTAKKNELLDKRLTKEVGKKKNEYEKKKKRINRKNQPPYIGKFLSRETVEKKRIERKKELDKKKNVLEKRSKRKRDEQNHEKNKKRKKNLKGEKLVPMPRCAENDVEMLEKNESVEDIEIKNKSAEREMLDKNESAERESVEDIEMLDKNESGEDEDIEMGENGIGSSQESSHYNVVDTKVDLYRFEDHGELKCDICKGTLDSTCSTCCNRECGNVVHTHKPKIEMKRCGKMVNFQWLCRDCW